MESLALERTRTFSRGLAAIEVRRLTDAERLTALWVSLAAVLAVARFAVLRLAERTPGNGKFFVCWLPLAMYQDVALVLLLACLCGAMLCWSNRSWLRRVVRVAAWSVSLVVAIYAAMHVEIYRFLKTPLTYRLILMSDRLRGIRTSIDAALTHERLMGVIGAPIATVVLVLVAIVCVSQGVARVHAAASRVRWRALAGAYVVVAFAVTQAARLDAACVANPHAALVASFWDRSDPFLSAEFSESDLADFRPPSGDGTSRSAWRGRVGPANVVLVVMESVGSQYMGHFGAPYANSPELDRLARRGVTFDRIYASQPYTSNAMAGIFCSVYPWHGWRSLPGRAPAIRITGLGDVLRQRGYRTAFLHTGDLRFDSEHEFLARHGFDDVRHVVDLKELATGDFTEPARADEWLGDAKWLPDRMLLDATRTWLDADPERPFFLTLWTIQTHHPYFADAETQQRFVRDPDQNRYLSAIADTDRRIGELYRELELRGLSDSTLFIVVGDHGDSFEQHGYFGHAQTLYEETVRVPLVMIHPRLAAAERRRDTLGQQLDIAPTALDLLGLDAPAEWQGRSLFATNRPNRAYLFTGMIHYLFGVVEGDRKFIYDATTNRREVYDLRVDPGERMNLVNKRSGQDEFVEQQRLLAGWLKFQNEYLSQFVPDQRKDKERSQQIEQKDECRR
jgi:arylsulfatase A-like enzyme